MKKSGQAVHNFEAITNFLNQLQWTHLALRDSRQPKVGEVCDLIYLIEPSKCVATDVLWKIAERTSRVTSYRSLSRVRIVSLLVFA